MPATLKTTTYVASTHDVMIVATIIVQSTATDVACVAPEVDLLAIATADGRNDWSTEDCCTFATTAIGMPVTL